MRQVEGFEPEEVESLLGIAPANQRVMLHRARRKLRGILAAREGLRS